MFKIIVFLNHKNENRKKIESREAQNKFMREFPNFFSTRRKSRISLKVCKTRSRKSTKIPLSIKRRNYAENYFYDKRQNFRIYNFIFGNQHNLRANQNSKGEFFKIVKTPLSAPKGTIDFSLKDGLIAIPSFKQCVTKSSYFSCGIFAKR